MYRFSAIALTLALFYSCSKNPVDNPPSSTLVGQYEATTFSAALAPLPAIDILALGGIIELTLRADNKTTGRIFIPDTPGLTQGAIDYNLEGNYTASGDTLTLSHNADTFLRDMKWVLKDGKLQANYSETGVDVIVILEKQ